MNKKELISMLKGYNYIVADIENYNQEILNLSEVIGSKRELHIPTLTGMPRGSDIADTTYKKVEKIIDTYCKQVAKIEANIENLFNKKNEIEDLVNSLEERESKIIKLKFFKKYNWIMIERTMNYSRSQCFNIYNKAIDEMLDKVNQ